MSDSYESMREAVRAIRQRLTSHMPAIPDSDTDRHTEKTDAALNEAEIRLELLSELKDREASK